MQGTAHGLTDLDPGLLQLLTRQAEQPVFLHPAWLRTWLTEFGEGCEPCLLGVPDSPLLGLAPLMQLDGRLTFVGDPSICDYMDFLVAPEASDEAYASLWQQLQREDWYELDLWGLRASSPTRAAIRQRAEQAGYEVMEEQEAVAPRLQLPASFEDYLASLNRKDRHELRRKTRRLFDSGGDVDFTVLSEQADVVAAMDTFLELHTGSRMDKTNFMTDGMASFFRRMASALSAAGLVRLFLLTINGKPAATVLCFDAGNSLYLYNSGYDPDFSGLSVGLVSKALCLRWAIEQGKQTLDFLRGNEAYKYDLGAVDQEIFRLQIRRSA